jgi:hypothetical protein
LPAHPRCRLEVRLHSTVAWEQIQLEAALVAIFHYACRLI